MHYIQRRDHQTRQLETIDEFATRKEASDMRYEYVMSDSFATYYLSKRPCKDWKAKTPSPSPEPESNKTERGELKFPYYGRKELR